MNKNNQRPAKKVLFSPEDTRLIELHGGGGSKKFKNITNEFRNHLISTIEDTITTLLNDEIEAFAMIVELEPDSLAKSHRPTSIFNENTCPFIGDIGIDTEERVGRFLIKATKHGLLELRQKIETVSSKNPLAALSAVKDIKPYFPEFEIDKLSSTGDYIIRLVYLNDVILDKKNEQIFLNLLQTIDASFTRIDKKLPLYRVKTNQQKSVSLLEKLVNNPLIFSIQNAKSFHIHPMSSTFTEIKDIDFLLPEEDKSYPVVGVVDSSIKTNCPYIKPWFDGEITAIIEDEKNYFHGTFVAGLISNAQNLNNFDNDFPDSQSKVFSVGVLDSNGSSMDEILLMLERAQIERPDIKIWNLSLGSDEAAPMNRISNFAILLDEFQHKYNSLCIISAGNIEDINHLRQWPPATEFPTNEQRISSPGDSVLGLTVASVAHIDGIVHAGEPSIFSRSGPIANLVLKPDLSHYGGNHRFINSDIEPLGISSVSINEKNQCTIKQDCGTSFSTPLVSTIAANLWHTMGNDTPRHTIKGLLLHSARLRHDIPKEHRLYYGWGIPLDVNDYMYCNENEITIILEGEIRSNTEEVGKLPFPMPESLKTDDGKIKAEIFMTISYDSPLDSNRALEYCLVNIDAGLGKVDNGKFNGQVPAEGSGFEQELINGSYKWSPVKTYHAKFPRGINVENWKLRVKMLTREGYSQPDNFKVPFTIILTIRALEEGAQVYNEMVQLMNQYNWQVENAINIDTRIRL